MSNPTGYDEDDYSGGITACYKCHHIPDASMRRCAVCRGPVEIGTVNASRASSEFEAMRTRIKNGVTLIDDSDTLLRMVDELTKDRDAWQRSADARLKRGEEIADELRIKVLGLEIDLNEERGRRLLAEGERDDLRAKLTRRDLDAKEAELDRDSAIGRKLLAEAKLAEAEADYEQSRKQLWQQTKELSARLAEAERSCAAAMQVAMTADVCYAHAKRRAEAAESVAEERRERAKKAELALEAAEARVRELEASRVPVRKVQIGSVEFLTDCPESKSDE